MNQRPHSLAEVAQRSEDLRSFGWELQDWLHTVRAIRTRSTLRRALAPEPVLLAKRFPVGRVADAWLAAYAEHAANVAGLNAPEWSRRPNRFLADPWFSVEAPAERLLALRDSPAAFKNRNLFTPLIDFPLRLRAGRPAKSAEEKRRTNAGRQRRFRLRRALELDLLRHALAAS
ncbi:MAG: hypothetical protein HY736_13205 [Verrucomicrobia bacterium]|nr:hypothetical protein [Verrucomicrobiota bacterium]